MPDKPATKCEQKKDRRGMLALMGAGGAAAVAALLSQRNEAEGGHDGTDVFHLGANNIHLPGSVTQRTAAIAGNALRVNNSSADDGASAVAGQSDGVGSTAVPFAAGLIGYATGAAGTQGGVIGTANNGRGVIGCHGGTPAIAPTKVDIGVLGLAKNASGGGTGVWGASTTGVRGEGKRGVHGLSSSGSGVKGEGTGAGSIGVFAKNIGTRRALRTKGRVQMDTVRKKSLANKSNLIALPTGVNAGSNAAVLATMQGNPGNDAVIWRAFRVDATHIRIAFNKKPANPVSVAYWVVHPA